MGEPGKSHRAYAIVDRDGKLVPVERISDTESFMRLNASANPLPEYSPKILKAILLEQSRWLMRRTEGKLATECIPLDVSTLREIWQTMREAALAPPEPASGDRAPVTEE